jgi:PAS domain-containing protein
MLAQEIDFHGIFKVSPTAAALLTPEFVIVDANDEFVTALGRPLADLVGRNIFKVFPKRPDDPGNPKRTALEAALFSGEREALELTRYDIEDPGRPGVFEERYWSSVVTPVRADDGQVILFELSAREVTPIINQIRATEAREAWAGGA